MFALVSLLVAIAAPIGGPPPPPPSGNLRVPQVVVHGTALQDRFLDVGQNIDVGTEQFDAELMQSNVNNSNIYKFQIWLEGTSSQRVIGLYDGHAPVPTTFPIFPDNAIPGWFAVVSFRSNPTRFDVQTFDNNAMLVSSPTYPGGNRLGIGFYLQGPDGTFFSQDARNPGGSPQALFYRGTGALSGQLWLAFEDRSLQAGSDQDFDDVFLFIEGVFSGVVPVETTTWGQLKARFR